MSDDASAYPDNLMNYANKAKPNDTDLQSVGNDISRKLAAFLGTNPDPKVLPAIRDLGKEVTAYASQKSTIDQWVFDVGLAFLTASTSAHPAGPGSYDVSFSLGTQLSVTTNATVAKDLADNAITQQARSNADQLKNLLDNLNNNPMGLHRNQAQFEQLLNWLQFYKDDPVQAAAFFNELGPQKTLALVNAMQFLNMGDAKMAELSQSLAAASQSETFDPNFAVNLANAAAQPNMNFGQQDQRYQLGQLFKSGVFSSDFLTKFGDQYLYRVGPKGGALQFDYGDQVVGPFLNALSRNPEAAYAYLTGPSPMPDMPKWVIMGQQGNPTGTSRLAQLETFMSTWSMGGAGWPRPDWVNGLNQSLLAADRQATDMGDPAQVQALLHDLSDADLNMVNDGYRPVIAQLVSEHIDVFVPPISASNPRAPQIAYDWTWAEKLFKGAVADGSGHVNTELMVRIQGAIQVWSTQHMPSLDPSSPHSMDQFRVYMYQVGALWGMSALPARQAGFDLQALQQEEQQTLSLVLSLIPLKVPGLDKIGDEGLKKLANYLSTQAIGQLKKQLPKWVVPPTGNPNKDAVEIYYNQLAGMRLMLAQQFVSQHPDLLAGKTSDQVQQYIVDLAAGADPGQNNTAVSQFEADLDSASLMFAEQYNSPGTSGPK